MNPEDVGRILDEIGERIGPAGEYAWGLAVRQVYIEGTIGSILGSALAIATLVAGVGALVLIYRRYLADLERTKGAGRYDRTDPFGYVLSALAVLSLGGAAFGFCLTWAVLAIQQLLNPEYHAMIRLLDSVVPR